MFGHQDDQQTLNDTASAATNSSWPHDDSDGNVSSAPAAPAAPTQPQPDVTDSSNNLVSIKQQALSQLQPLVSQLDQSPEERFRTLMMMIQASDDQSLIKSAYEAASQISDEKQKAQALLDIVNEINYFTHPHNEN